MASLSPVTPCQSYPKYLLCPELDPADPFPSSDEGYLYIYRVSVPPLLRPNYLRRWGQRLITPLVVF